MEERKPLKNSDKNKRAGIELLDDQLSVPWNEALEMTTEGKSFPQEPLVLTNPDSKHKEK